MEMPKYLLEDIPPFIGNPFEPLRWEMSAPLNIRHPQSPARLLFDALETYGFSLPACFITGIVPEDRDPAALCADAHFACGYVMAGNPPPPAFGDAMAEIAFRLGVTGTADSFIQWSEAYFAAKDGASDK